MKFFKIFTLFLALSIFSVKSYSQVDVTVNPIGILFGDLSLGADFVLADNLSIEGTIGIGGSKEDLGIASYKYFNLPITAVGKYYFNPDNPASKFYADAFVKFVTRSYKADGEGSTFVDYDQTRLGVGMGIGWKVVSQSGIVFDFGFGAGRAFINNTSLSDDDDELIVDWPEIMFQGKLGIGYRFGN